MAVDDDELVATVADDDCDDDAGREEVLRWATE